MVFNKNIVVGDNKSGFTLIELIVVIVIFSFLMVAIIPVIQQIFMNSTMTKEVFIMESILDEKVAQIKNMNFVADSSEVVMDNYSVSINVVYMKGDEWVPFEDGADLDNPRNKLKIEMIVQGPKYSRKRVFYKAILKEKDALRGILYYLKSNLTLFKEGKGYQHYHQFSLSDVLDSGYIVEIPNDPFTESKDTNVDDYVYEHKGKKMYLYAKSHPGIILEWLK